MLKLRPRRLRLNENLRSMVRETNLSVKDLIYPLFVVAGENVREEIPSMPDCYHLSVDNAVELAKKISALGIPAVEIFGLPEYKDEIKLSKHERKVYQPYEKYFLLNPGQLIHGICDFNADKPVKIYLMMYPENADPLEFLDRAEILPKDQYALRGNFILGTGRLTSRHTLRLPEWKEFL